MTLTAKRETQIIDEEIDAMFADEEDVADDIIEDGGMPGDLELTGPERLKAYFAADPVTGQPLISFNDMLRMTADPDWEQHIRDGFDTGPESPLLKNWLRVPGLFKKMSADFVSLNERYPPEDQR